MKNSALLLTFFLLNLQVSLAQVMWQVTSKDIIPWRYHSGDEFNGTTPDLSYWYTGAPFGRSYLRYDSYFYEANSKTRDGLLHSVADTGVFYETIEPWLIDSALIKKNKIVPVDGKYRFNYSTAMLWSKPFYKNGYFEIRFKAPKGSGLWPAFWLYGQNSSDEIDFFELKGEQNNKIHVDVHCPVGCDGGFKYGLRSVNWGGWISIDKFLHDGFNVISGIWEPDNVQWFLNGTKIANYPGSFATKMSLIVNLAVAKNNMPFAPGPDNFTPFPSDFQVDYVRVFGHADTTIDQHRQLIYYPDTLNSIVPKKIKAKKFLFNKKEAKNTIGFVSFYKSAPSVYTIELKGNLNGITYEVSNNDGTVALNGKLKSMFNSIDVAGLKKGKYRLKITLKDKRNLEQEFTI